MPVRESIAAVLLAMGGVLPPVAFAGETPHAPVQILRLDDPGKPEAVVGGDWQFHQGDSPAVAGTVAPLWSEPALDDSGWRRVQADTLDDQNLPWSQFSWYRRHVEIARPGSGQPLTVYVQAVDTYAVYWNGQLLGSMGGVPPSFNWPSRTRGVFEIPLPEAAQSVSGVLAIRVWCQYPASLSQDCGFLEPPRMGPADLERSHDAVDAVSGLASEYPGFALVVLTVFGALVGFIVYLRSGRQPLYLWFAVLLLGAGVWQGSYLAYFLPANWGQASQNAWSALIQAGFLLLLSALLGTDKDRRLNLAVRAIAIVYVLNDVFDASLCLFWAHAGPVMRQADAISTVIEEILRVAPLVLLGVAVMRRQTRGDWPLIVTGTLFAVSNSLEDLRHQWPGLLPPALRDALLAFAQMRRVGVFVLHSDSFALVLLLVAVSLSVGRHFFAERRRQHVVEQELHSAREIQQMLVPEAVPPIPGFAIETIYRPASEVGGDFFQILPLDSGETLVAIGDVSGKGLKAAMIVSLIVGTLRAVAGYTQQPAKILTALNATLHGRVGSGFVTCLVLRVPRDGPILIANAGHLAPYVNGHEWEIAGSLPLGMMAHVEYEQAALELAPGDSVTLLTDGVPEAQNGQKELFGFARLAGLLARHPSAAAVVEAACCFGQEDDITVLTLARLASAAPRGWSEADAGGAVGFGWIDSERC